MLHIKEDARELAENERPVAVAVDVVKLPDGREVTLYVGNYAAVCDEDTLVAHNITSTLNVSLNISIPPMQFADGMHVRRANVGLIDGDGNLASHMAGAVLVLHGLLTQASPGKPYYPKHCYGNVMVNCRGGRSRSVTVLAVYMLLMNPDRWNDLRTAIAHIRTLRGNADHYPLEPMILMGERLVNEGSLRKLLAI